MKIKRKSLLTGKELTLDLDVTEEQMSRWMKGELSQNVFSHLTVDEREFIKTGIVPSEWEALFGRYK